MLTDILISLLILTSALFTLAGSVGLARLPDFYMRLHGPSKSTTLGVGGVLLASALYFSTREGVSVNEILIAGFLFIAAPVAAHLLACAAIRSGAHSRVPVPDELKASVERLLGK